MHMLDQCGKIDNVDKMDVIYTSYAGHARDLSQRMASGGTDIIIAIGGDGTLHEVINGIMELKNNDVIIGIIPNGTGNDFTKGLRIKYVNKNFLNSLLNKKFRRIDVGLIKQSTSETYFINAANLGFGGHAVSRLIHRRSKGWKGGVAYSLAILDSFRKYDKPLVHIESDQFRYDGPLMMLSVCNGSTIGNGLVIHPMARPDDGVFGVTVIGKVSILDYIFNYINLRRGKKIKHPEVAYHSSKNVQITIEEGQCLIEADGELIGGGDCSFSLLPGRIKLLDY